MSRPKMKMRNVKRLKYGQTPWDRLTKKELLLMVCRYHSALSSAASCLWMMHSENVYWSVKGSGGRALAKADFLRNISGEDSDLGAEKIYRSFFRYTDEVLFPGLALDTLGPWQICDTCGAMVKVIIGGSPSHFGSTKCSGHFREFRMEDIRKDLA